MKDRNKQPIKSLNELAKNEDLKFIVIRKDETQFWREDIAAKAKKIEGVYLVDLTQPTNLCELAISYPAYFLKNYLHDISKFSEEEVINMEMDTCDDPWTYFSGYSEFVVAKQYCTDDLNSEETTDDQFRSTIDYEQGNPSVC